MGLKRDNYKVTSLGLDLASAYARITDVSVDLNGRAHAIFKIQQDREQIYHHRYGGKPGRQHLASDAAVSHEYGLSAAVGACCCGDPL